MRRRIISCVLATDMIHHSKQLQYLKIKSESIGIDKGQNNNKILENLDSVDLFNTQQEYLNIFLHISDISNPTKNWEVYEEWSKRVMNEFWMQGDEELRLNLPISFLCNRETVQITNAQIGFIEGIVFPIYSLTINIFPELMYMLDNCRDNKEKYILIKQKEMTK